MDTRTDHALPLTTEPQVILQQLERVLNSPYFQASKQLSRFLRFVVEENLSSRGDKLSQYAIAVEALGRPKDFDPETDPVIRIEARRLRQTLALYYQHDGQRDPIRIEIPTGCYSPVFQRNGTATEPGAAGLRSVASAADDSRHARGTEGPTVALLNFNFLSQDEETGDIAISITEDLAAALSRFEFIRLIRPADPEKFNREDASDCGVHYLLDGSVQKWSEGIQLLARLCDPITGELIWSESFMLSTDEAMALTSRRQVIHRLAAAIADFHGAVITHWASQALRDNSEIAEQHEAFVRFRYFLNRLDRDAFEGAVQACEKALRRWPDDALANSLLADLYVMAYLNEFPAIDSPLQIAEKAACNAVALQPAYHFTRFSLGKVYFAQAEPGPCLAEFERCLELNPYSASVAAWIGMYLCLLGEWQRGSQLVSDSMALTPDSPVYHFTLALNYYREGAFDLAWIEARRIHVPDLFWDTLIRAACLGQLGRFEEAQVELKEMLRLCPDFKKRGPQRMRNLLFSEQNVTMLLEGLHQAGLNDFY